MKADLRWIPIDRIDPADDNPRRTLTGINELAANIAAVVLLTPVGVEEAGDRFRLVAEARRHAAALKAGSPGFRRWSAGSTSRTRARRRCWSRTAAASGSPP
jgi:hypothetical protein